MSGKIPSPPFLLKALCLHAFALLRGADCLRGRGGVRPAARERRQLQAGGAGGDYGDSGIQFRGLADFEWSVLPVEGYPIIAFNQEASSGGGEVELKYNYTGNLGVAAGGSYAKYLSFEALTSDCDRNKPVDPSVMTLEDADGGSAGRIMSSSGGQNNEVDLFVDINQETISSSRYYTEAQDGLSAEIAFCVRGSYVYDDDNDASTPDQGVNFHETVLTISVDLTANFTLSAISVDRTGADDASADLLCRLRAYFCEGDDNVEIDPPVLTQGDDLQFCVEVDTEDRTNFFIRDIMETDVEQDNNVNGVFREAGDEFDDIVVGYEPDFLTTKNCVAGVCQVRTQLKSKYFADLFPNPLSIAGSALCALGSAPPGETGHAIPLTAAATTPAPAPGTQASKAPEPANQAPTTPAPETQAPATPVPETQAPTTPAPETQAPATTAPTQAPGTPAPTAACVPDSNTCCQDSDCVSPFGGVCDRETGTCACDASKCESVVSVGNDKICMSSCDCPEDCNSATGSCYDSPEENCAACGSGSGSCEDGYACDGLYCVPAGRCTARKQKLCDNSYFEITGNKDQRAKCCPDSSGCVSGALKLDWNSVCSTNCGESCMGTIQSDKNYPQVLCAAVAAPLAEFLGLEMCYEDVVKPYCEDATGLVDAGTEMCKDFHAGESAGCTSPYTVCCKSGFESSLNCDPDFVVPDDIPE